LFEAEQASKRELQESLNTRPRQAKCSTSLVDHPLMSNPSLT
jgi:hypothetical protein